MRRAVYRELALCGDVTILTAACVWCVAHRNPRERQHDERDSDPGRRIHRYGRHLGLAGRLKGRDDVHITLVNPQTRFTERLRLHQTASGQTLADLQIPDLLAGHRRRLRARAG